MFERVTAALRREHERCKSIYKDVNNFRAACGLRVQAQRPALIFSIAYKRSSVECEFTPRSFTPSRLSFFFKLLRETVACHAAREPHPWLMSRL